MLVSLSGNTTVYFSNENISTALVFSGDSEKTNCYKNKARMKENSSLSIFMDHTRKTSEKVNFFLTKTIKGLLAAENGLD